MLCFCCNILWIFDVLKQKILSQDSACHFQNLRNNPFTSVQLVCIKDVVTGCVLICDGGPLLGPKGETVSLHQNFGVCSWQWQLWELLISSFWDSNGMRSSLSSNKILLDSLGNGLRSNSTVWLDKALPPATWSVYEINCIVKPLTPLIHGEKADLLHNTRKLLLCLRIAILFPTWPWLVVSVDLGRKTCAC